MLFNLSPQSVRGPRNSWVDMIRGLAIFGVVSVHTSIGADAIVRLNKADPQRYLTFILSLGKYGVELFFFISGWLLISIYGNNKLPTGINYWSRRITRIWPLWILFLFFQILRSRIGNGGGGWQLVTSDSSGHWATSHGPILIIFLTLTFLLWLSPILWNTVLPGGWSIQAEVGHYILFPFVRRFSFSSIIFILTAVNFTMAIMKYWMEGTDIGNVPILVLQFCDAWYRLNIFSTFSYFFVGMTGFQLVQKYDSGLTLRESCRELRIRQSLAYLFFLSLMVAPLNFGNNWEAILVISTMIIFSLTAGRRIILRKFFSVLGTYSYFIYFCHFQVISLIAYLSIRISIPPILLRYQFFLYFFLLMANLAISTFLAKISWKYIENPIIGLGRRIGSDLRVNK